MAMAATSSALVPALVGGRRRTPSSRRAAAGVVRCSLDSKVSDMAVNAPKGLFPPEPEHYRGPKLKVAIIGAGLASMSTAVELLDQGHEVCHEVDLYDSRKFIGGKVGSFVDKQVNHIEMGLHVFFGCYSNLFRLMKKVGADNNLLVKEHTHTFVNKGGTVGELDFRFPVGAPLHGIQAFLRTNQLKKGKEVILYNIYRDHNSPVAKATILSIDWRKVVGGKELGPEYCEVVVNYIIKRDAVLPRGVGNMTTMAQAQGQSIAWPYKHLEADCKTMTRSTAQKQQAG